MNTSVFKSPYEPKINIFSKKSSDRLDNFISRFEKALLPVQQTQELVYHTFVFTIVFDSSYIGPFVLSIRRQDGTLIPILDVPNEEYPIEFTVTSFEERNRYGCCTTHISPFYLHHGFLNLYDIISFPLNLKKHRLAIESLDEVTLGQCFPTFFNPCPPLIFQKFICPTILLIFLN